MKTTCTKTVDRVKPLPCELPDAPAKWRLRCGLLYAGLGKHLRPVLVEQADALTFDAEDSQAIKLAFWQAVTGYKFIAEEV